MPTVVNLSLKDENFAGNIIGEIPVSFSSEKVTVMDIITARVHSEVAAYNNKQPEYFNGLVEPSEAEKTINGYKLRNRKRIDAEQQTLVALSAFQKNGFFVLVDQEQAVSLDQEVQLSAATRISFVKLTPLVGG